MKKGDRVELVRATDQYTRLRPGSRGVMLSDAPEPNEHFPIVVPGGTLIKYHILSVRWDNGSWLQMIPEAGDEIIVVENEAICPTCGAGAFPCDFTENKPGMWRCDGVDASAEGERAERHEFTYVYEPAAAA